MKEEDVYTAIEARLKLMETAIADTRSAMLGSGHSLLKMSVRDIGFLAFEMHQHLLRLPIHGVDLTR